MLAWSVSTTFLFKEWPFPDRFAAAAAAGFRAVEFAWPSNADLQEIVAAKEASQLTVAAFNMDAGDVASGDRGFANDPARQTWWRERAEAAFELAERMNAPRINILAGNEVPGLTRTQMVDCLLENLNWALVKAQALGKWLLLEPLNRFENPQYMLTNTQEAVSLIERLGSPTIELQLDVYHAQRNAEDTNRLLKQHIKYTGHIQIADSSNRGQPGSGEIDWRTVLGSIEALKYSGFIGIEYNPAGHTLDSLDWIPFGNRVQCNAADLVFA